MGQDANINVYDLFGLLWRALFLGHGRDERGDALSRCYPPSFLADDELSLFLRHYEALPWSPGEWVDCGLAIAAWAIWNGRPDPAAHLRGTYTAGQGQLDLLERNGGTLLLVRSCLVGIGCQPTASPARGDVGVVGSHKHITRQFGVIHDGNGWLTRTAIGFEPITARTLAAWII